jgi:hypothetical protein
MVANQIDAGRRNQGDEFLHEFRRREYHVRRPVPPAVLQAIQQSPVGQLLETFGRDWGPGDVTAQSLQPAAIIRWRAHVGVKVHTGAADASRPLRDPHFFSIDPISPSCDSLACAGTRGHALSDGGAVQRREQRLFPTKRVNLAGLVTLSEATALEKIGQTPGDAGADGGNLVVVGRGQRSETHSFRVVSDVDAVQHQCVEMQIEIQRVAESLYEGHGSTSRIGRSEASPCATSEGTEQHANEQP